MQDLAKKMVSRIEDIGRAQGTLKMILDHEVFDRLSKHNPYWDSIDPDAAEKLDEIRRMLSCVSDNLWDLWAILRKDDE